MSRFDQERHECDAIVEVVINTMPQITGAAVEARHGTKPMHYRRARLAAAIDLADNLAAQLRESQKRLGWDDPRSDAA